MQLHNKTVTGDKVRLVFHCYDDHYFLSEIWTPMYASGGWSMAQSPSELKLAKSSSPQHVIVQAR